MAKKKAKKTAARKVGKKASKGRGRAAAAPGELLISKSRTKAAAGINVAGDFYVALDAAVRHLIATAEKRAEANGRRTLRPQDL